MKVSKLNFRTATLQDIPHIIKINDDYLEYDSKNGFLITPSNSDKFKTLILNHPNSISVATTSDDYVVGFVEVSPTVGESVITALNWNDQDFKLIFENRKKLYIEKVAVRRDYLRHKVASFLYESLFSKHKESVFYAFIVKKPVTNVASLNFHKRLGFREVAIFRVDEFLGIKNYQSVMLMKWNNRG